MTRPTIQIVDVLTQEEIVREMNDEEYAEYLNRVEMHKALQAEEQVLEG